MAKWDARKGMVAGACPSSKRATVRTEPARRQPSPLNSLGYCKNRWIGTLQLNGLLAGF
jgi:hypothetical protein